MNLFYRSFSINKYSFTGAFARAIYFRNLYLKLS